LKYHDEKEVEKKVDEKPPIEQMREERNPKLKKIQKKKNQSIKLAE